MPPQMRREGEAAVITLNGRLTLGDPIDELRACCDQALQSGAKDLVVNLADVTAMDSSGIGVMIRCHAAVRQGGGKLRLVGANATVRRAFKVSRLDQVFEFYDSEHMAMAAAGS